MKKMTTSLIVGMMVVMMMSCATHYSVNSISRTRMLIDQTYDRQTDAEAVLFMQPFKRQVDSLMSPVLGKANMPIEPYRPESPMSNLLPDILAWAAPQYGEKVDFALYNIGGMRASLAKGDITIGDVFEVAPFENYICFVTLTGDKVEELLGQVAYRAGEGVSKEVRIVLDADHKLLSATIGGAPIDKYRAYRIATLDYVSHGNDRMVAFKSSTDRHDITSEDGLARAVIMRYIQDRTAKGLAIESKIEGRITIKR
mgnify:CR=1 FL=1